MKPPHTSRSRLGAIAVALLTLSCQDQMAAPAASDSAVEIALASDIESERLELGRLLLFDERLSRPRGMACGTCHDPFRGWGDARPQGKGIQDNTLAGDTDGDGVPDHDSSVAIEGNFYKTRLTPRNTPTIYNSALFPNLFWDGRAGDLVHQAMFPVESGVEMNASWELDVLPTIEADPYYRELFNNVYGGSITKLNAVDAIGAYEATISVFDTPYDAHLAGDTSALTGDELLGHDLFFGKAGCAQCHPAPLLTNFEFINTGVPTVGQLALQGIVDLGHGQFTDLTQDPPVDIDNPADYATFKVPQLRMVAVTGPFMHNGALETLEDVVDFYDAGGGPDLSGTGSKDSRIAPLGLTSSEKAALVAFLENGLMGTEIQ